MSPANQKRLDRIAAVILSATVFLSLIAFVPGGSMAGSVLKGYLLIIGSTLAFLFWIVARLIEGSVSIPRSRLLSALGIFAGVEFISAVFSHTPYLSFFGQGFDLGTAFSSIALVLMSFLVSVLIVSKKRLALFVSGFFAVYVVLALFQFLHLFFPIATSFGALSGATATTLGSWVDFGYLSGMALIGFVLLLSFFKPTKPVRLLASLGSLLALFFIVLIGSRAVFLLVGISAISILTYKILAGRSFASSRFPTMAFILALLMLFAFLTTGIFGSYLATKLGASYTEIHPNLSTTLSVAHLSLSAHPLVGPGPNTFFPEWILHRPVAFNQSTYWDVPFAAGSSFLLTTAFLAGLLGILGVLLVLAAFVLESIRRVFRFTPHSEGSTVVFSFFLSATYLLVTLLVASVTIGIVVLAFFFLGLCIAVIQIEKRSTSKEISFSTGYRRGFWSIFCIVALIFLGVTELTFATKRFVAEIYFAKGSTAALASNFAQADARYATAIKLVDLPKYEEMRTVLAEHYLSSIFAQNSGSASLSDDAKTAIQNAVAVGTASATRAVALDPTSVDAYLALGDFTRLLAPLKIQNAFTTSESAYKKAQTIAPNYPKTPLNLGELYYGVGRASDARAYAHQALALKPNYTDAYFLLAEIDGAAGDTVAELVDLESAAKADTIDATALLALGEFQYKQGSYADAISTLENAVTASRSSIEAWYYLALADGKAGDKTDAARILSTLHSAYSENTDVTSALVGLSNPTPTPGVVPKPKTK